MGIDELTLEVTHSCSNDCYFCSSKNTVFDVGEEVLWYERNIEDLLDKFEPEVVRWSGGEPFTYLNEEFLEIPKKRGIKQIVTTNGTNWEFIESLYEYFEEIRFTLYGLPEDHNKITGSDKSFECLMDSLSRIRSKDSVNIALTTPLISERQMWGFSTMSKALGLDIRITGLVPTDSIERPENPSEILNMFDLETESCSLGGSECGWEDKRLVMPDGRVIHCATEKLGYHCPYRGK